MFMNLDAYVECLVWKLRWGQLQEVTLDALRIWWVSAFVVDNRLTLQAWEYSYVIDVCLRGFVV